MWHVCYTGLRWRVSFCYPCHGEEGVICRTCISRLGDLLLSRPQSHLTLLEQLCEAHLLCQPHFREVETEFQKRREGWTKGGVSGRIRTEIQAFWPEVRSVTCPRALSGLPREDSCDGKGPTFQSCFGGDKISMEKANVLAVHCCITKHPEPNTQRCNPATIVRGDGAQRGSSSLAPLLVLQSHGWRWGQLTTFFSPVLGLWRLPTVGGQHSGSASIICPARQPGDSWIAYMAALGPRGGCPVSESQMEGVSAFIIWPWKSHSIAFCDSRSYLFGVTHESQPVFKGRRTPLPFHGPGWGGRKLHGMF